MNKYIYIILIVLSALSIESYSSAVKTFTCPYLGGNAVFRARILHGMKHFGIHYDDLEICNGQGVYKGGISKLQEQLNQLNNSKSNNTAREYRAEEVYVYPNPAINKLNIACKNAQEIIIYDLLGNALCKENLIWFD